MEDETLASPLDLLARYRKLCEAAGAAGLSGAPLPRTTREQLGRIEAELQSRLWLASAEAGRKTPLPASPSPPRGEKGGPTPLPPAPSPPRGEKGRVAGTSLPLSPSPSREEKGRKTEIPLFSDSSLEMELDAALGRAMVYCDGACIGNPGPGGYCALVRVPGHPEQVVSDGKARSTNNEMEMSGAVAGLKLALSLGATDLTVVSDSEYLVKGMTSWVRSWLRNGWKTRAGEPVKNRALWEELVRLCQGRSVTWTWVRGHAGHAENERCDALAVAAAEAAARGRAGR